MNIREIIANKVNGASFMSIDTNTAVTLRGGKQNPFQGRVRKTCVGSSVMVFQNKNVNGYDAMVRRRLEKEGKDAEAFMLSPRKWGTRIPNEPFVEHNGGLYLEVIFMRPGTTKYWCDGLEVAKADIEGLDAKEEAEQGGLENKVIIRTFRVDNITAMTVDGERYDVL